MSGQYSIQMIIDTLCFSILSYSIVKIAHEKMQAAAAAPSLASRPAACMDIQSMCVAQSNPFTYRLPISKPCTGRSACTADRRRRKRTSPAAAPESHTRPWQAITPRAACLRALGAGARWHASAIDRSPPAQAKDHGRIHYPSVGVGARPRASGAARGMLRPKGARPGAPKRKPLFMARLLG
jgi:hypothetical protein